MYLRNPTQPGLRNKAHELRVFILKQTQIADIPPV